MNNRYLTPINDLVKLIKHIFLAVLNAVVTICTFDRINVLEGMSLKNRYFLWHREISYPSHVYYPRSVNELRNLVKSSSRFRVVGAGKSNNHLADSPTLISLDNLNKIVELDSKGVVTVQGGARLNELAEYLDRFGRAVQVLPTSSRISIGGAVVNNVHLSGDRTSAHFTDSIIELTIMTSCGDIVTVKPHVHSKPTCQTECDDINSRKCCDKMCCKQFLTTLKDTECKVSDDDIFNAVINSAGCVAIVLEAKILTIPQEYFKVKILTVPSTKLNTKLKTLIRCSDKVFVFYVPKCDASLVMTQDLTTKPYWIVGLYYKLMRTIALVANVLLFSVVFPILTMLGLRSLNQTIINIIPSVSIVVPSHLAMFLSPTGGFFETEFSYPASRVCLSGVLKKMSHIMTHNSPRAPFASIGIRFSSEQKYGLLGPNCKVTENTCDSDVIDAVDPVDPVESKDSVYGCGCKSRCSGKKLSSNYVWISSLSTFASGTVPMHDEIVKYGKQIGARFHTGKHLGTWRDSKVDDAYMKQIYGDKYDKFIEVRNSLDPEGKMLNSSNFLTRD
ncbi:FAD-binding protein [Yasminevirus sp. GU-2018]|uniref:FAD-binding protein n=1 Tax=Yasminevirus sp. GU-2018 TaxID=2420051 RepID=A0A5K0U8J1_9VIRU|nr:FAD-binding protein [Yasminevirus sp. GU-2018]